MKLTEKLVNIRLMDKEIQYRLIRETIDRLKVISDSPPEAMRTRYSEFSALSDSLATITRSPALPSLCGPQVHFDEQGHMWL